jgi:hypothetical protein
VLGGVTFPMMGRIRKERGLRILRDVLHGDRCKNLSISTLGWGNLLVAIYR